MRAIVAIMFTDIAGYTAIMQRDEYEASEIRQSHRKHFNSLTKKFDGKILQYYGDGTLSIFDSAYQSVLCAIELQKAFRKEKEIPVRIGINVGEIFYDKEDVVGDAVNIASRIESLAKVGSVLISEKVYAEIKNKRDIRSQSLGNYLFKNVSHPIEVFAIVDDALYLPQLNELSGKLAAVKTTYSLPKFPNTFIGRQHYIQQLKIILQKESTRLVSLLGPGGMGKTRLAVRLGESLGGSFQDGVCFVPLDIITDHQQVPLYIAQSLELSERLNTSWTERVIDFLKDKNLLLILDNLEQVLPSAQVINFILKNCPRVKILATSREALGLSFEMEYPLDSLNRPNSRLLPDLENLLKFEAVDLFIQKAKSVCPSFQLNPKNAKAVVQICQDLDGLPLAIELAAARVKLFSPETILKKLASNLDLLKTRSKDKAERHQTIRKTVQWSYELLDSEEQEIFQQLSMFKGGFTFDALEKICPEFDCFDVLETFINKSLITKGEEIEDTSRFKMLKLIRDFGSELVAKNQKKSQYDKQFSTYFASFIENAAAELKSADQTKWINLIDAEYENLQVALACLMQHEPEQAAEFGVHFWRYFLQRGLLTEGLQMIENLLKIDLNNPQLEANLLEAAGTLSHNSGNYLQANKYFKDTLTIWEKLGAKTEIAKTLNHLGWAEWRLGNYDACLKYSKHSLAYGQELSETSVKARALNNKAWVYQYQGNFEKAAKLQQQVLSIHQQNQNRRSIAFAKTNLARALLNLDNLTEAEHLIADANASFEQLKDQQLLNFTRLVKSEFLHRKKDYRSEQNLLFNFCAPEFKKIGDRFGFATTHAYIGKLAFLEEDWQLAQQYLMSALNLFKRSSDKYGEAFVCLWLSKLRRQGKEVSEAEHYLNRAIALAKSMGANALLQVTNNEISKQSIDGNSKNTSQSLTKPSNPFTEKIQKCINAHLNDSNFSVPDLCRAVGMSHSQLHRKLVAATGLSVSRYIRSLRLKKAKELLREPQNTIAAVAIDSGFKDPDYFYRVFKQSFGQTPGEYREKIWKS